jgi:hypothetical protein
MTLAQRTLAEIEIARRRRDDPDTSHAAAREAFGVAAAHRQLILRVLRDGRGRDWTATEIADAADLTVVQVCRRLHELVADGEIEPTASRRPTASGRMARAFALPVSASPTARVAALGAARGERNPEDQPQQPPNER